MTKNAAPAAAPAPVFLPLVPEYGFWEGAANHACADPEYIHVPAHIVSTVTDGFCAGVDSHDVWAPRCRCCLDAIAAEIPF